MKARYELTTFWLHICHHTPRPWTMTRTNTPMLMIRLREEFSLNFVCNPEIWKLYFFFYSLEQSACKDNQSTCKCDTVRRLCYCITVTDHISYNNNNEFHIENWSLLSCYYIYSYVDCVHIKCIILTLKVTPLKNFDIVDLQTFHRWFVGIFRINISKFISRAWVIDSRLPTKRNHSIFISY